MMSAAEVFVVQLARASRKARRVVRHLQRADREDILAAALAWCWENRDNYSLTTSLDTWFVNAVRDAYKAWSRTEKRERTELVPDMKSNDDPEWNTIVADAVRALAASMDDVDRALVACVLDGVEERALIGDALGIDRATVTRRLARMRGMLPEGTHHGLLLRRAVTPRPLSSDDMSDQLSPIDHEIAALDFPPEHGKDCPPCWRCKWFEGYLPGDHISLRMPIVEASVRDAVANTEAEKIRIAKEVRDGNL